MPQAFYTILTLIGQAKLTNAQALGQTINLSHVAFGSGDNDAAYNPTETQEALKGEVFRNGIVQIILDEADPTRFTVESIIPQAEGGWTIREIGIFDNDGDLFAVGNMPDTYKPALGGGAVSDVLTRSIIKTGNAAQVELKIDPSIVLATKSYVINALATHSADPDAHDDFLRRNRTDTLLKGFWSKPVPVDIADGIAELDPELGNVFDFTADKTITIKNPETMPLGGMALIYARQDANGSRAINFGSAYSINNGQISTEGDAVNLIYLSFDGSAVVDVHITQRASA